MLCTQLSFASGTTPVLIPPDSSPNPQPGQTNRGTTDETCVSASATISDVELAVYFEWGVGDAVITVYDTGNNVVFQTTVNTYSITQVNIAVCNWLADEYTLTVSYASTTQRGSFQIEEQ